MNMAEKIGKSHPVLAKNIESCWIQADRLTPCRDFAHWRRETFHGFASLKNLLTGGPRDENWLESRYKHYVRLVNDQRDLCSGDHVARQVFTLFNACPNLQALWLTLGGQARKSTTHQHQSFIDAACAPSQDPLRMTNLGGAAAFQQSILAAAEANLQLHTLVVAGIGHMALNEVEADDKVTTAVAKVLKTVQNLHLQVRSPEELPNEPDSSKVGPTLRQWFTGHHQDMANLRHLHLELPPLQHFRSSSIDFEDLIAELKFPYLRRLMLTQFRADLTKLADFLLAHSVTLQTIRLANATGMGVMTWQSFFESIAGKIVALKVVELRAHFTHHLQRWSDGYWRFSNTTRSKGSQFADALSEYIIHGGPRFPVQNEQSHLLSAQGRAFEVEVPLCDMPRVVDEDADEGG